MSNDDYVIRIKRYDPTDPRLGRHVFHDSRSLRYLVPRVARLSTLASIRHTFYIGTLDQGELGSCTGNAGTLCCASTEFWAGPITTLLHPADEPANERFAVDLYSAATQIDSASGSYPPVDTGSDGLSVAKVLRKRGIISGYQHATSLDALLGALAKQPVIVGTGWRQDMFHPDSDGQMSITGPVQGGHEYCLDELDVDRRRVWMHNSWSDSWGVQGRAWFSYDQMEELLLDDGDCTVFTPAVQPAPLPTPVQSPQQVWVAKAQSWTGAKHVGANAQFASDTRAYLRTLGDS